MVLGSSPVAVNSPSDFAPASSKKFLDIQATIECGFTLKHVRDMTRTYSAFTYFPFLADVVKNHFIPTMHDLTQTLKKLFSMQEKLACQSKRIIY